MASTFTANGETIFETRSVSLADGDANELGELLRRVTFGDTACSAYGPETVQPADARVWAQTELLHELAAQCGEAEADNVAGPAGVSYTLGVLTIEAMWYVDGHLTLFFRILKDSEPIYELVTYDADKPDRWCDR